MRLDYYSLPSNDIGMKQKLWIIEVQSTSKHRPGALVAGGLLLNRFVEVFPFLQFH